MADLANDELKELLGDIKISSKDLDQIIMRARASWFEEETEKKKIDEETEKKKIDEETEKS